MTREVLIDEAVALLCPRCRRSHLSCDKNVTVSEDDSEVQFELECRHCRRELLLCVARRNDQTLLEVRGRP